MLPILRRFDARHSIWAHSGHILLLVSVRFICSRYLSWRLALNDPHPLLSSQLLLFFVYVHSFVIALAIDSIHLSVLQTAVCTSHASLMDWKNIAANDCFTSNDFHWTKDFSMPFSLVRLLAGSLVSFTLQWWQRLHAGWEKQLHEPTKYTEKKTNKTWALDMSARQSDNI